MISKLIRPFALKFSFHHIRLDVLSPMMKEGSCVVKEEEEGASRSKEQGTKPPLVNTKNHRCAKSCFLHLDNAKKIKRNFPQYFPLFSNDLTRVYVKSTHVSVFLKNGC